MANKIRIMELSSELGVSNKELLQVLRELDIPVKSHVSSISDEEAAQVREKMQRKDAPVDVQQREIQPGVILRRRKVAKPEAQKVSDASGDQPEDAPTPERTDGPEQDAVKGVAEKAEDAADAVAPAQRRAGKKTVDAPRARIIGTSEEPVAPGVKEPGAEEVGEDAPSTAVSEETQVRVEPDAPATQEDPGTQDVPRDAPGKPDVPGTGDSPADDVVTAPAEESAVSAKTESPDAAPPADAATGEESDAAASEAVGEKPKKRKPRKREPLVQTGPQVRIISKPEAKPDFSYKPESKPYTPTPVRTPGTAEAPARPGVDAGAQADSASDRKKKKKGKRTVEITQPSVLGEQNRSDPSWKKKKTTPVQDRTGGKFRAKRSRPKFRHEAEGQAGQAGTQPIKAAKRKIRMEEAIRVSEMAKQMGLKAQEIIKMLFSMGVMTTINQSIDMDTATLVAAEFGYEVEQVGFMEEGFTHTREEDKLEDLAPRSPVVTIMGHVDHGKTSLLDAIRESNVTKGEAGGITQHIGAYHVETNRGAVTFLDTPGHEAFTAMRARGAQVTDLVILVVAADDGVMEQTKEAVNHAKAAGVPIVVAVNKIDKDNADPQRVLAELAERELVPESWGGDTIVVEMSALENLGIDDLLDQLVVVAEFEELTANPTGRAKGIVLEANLDVGRGPVATVLVDKGELKVGDPIVAGAAWGKVRAMIDDQGNQIKTAGPSTPVQVLGLSSVPQAGDEFRAAPDEKIARTVAEAREHHQKIMAQRGDARVKTGVRLEDIFSQIQSGETATLNIILKADVQGSLEAVTESLKKLERDEVDLTFVHRAVGGITENDISLASTTNATILGFNVRPDGKARKLADTENVEIRTYEIIYKLLEDIEQAMVGMLAPEYEEVVTGEAEVREIFRVPRIGAIAGCYVRSGVITRGSKVRFLRDGTIIWKGEISSLRRFKDDAREVREGFECGVGLSDFQDLKPGDLIETFDEREIART